jgi:hypothetical protein
MYSSRLQEIRFQTYYRTKVLIFYLNTRTSRALGTAIGYALCSDRDKHSKLAQLFATAPAQSQKRFAIGDAVRTTIKLFIQAVQRNKPRSIESSSARLLLSELQHRTFISPGFHD